MRFTKRLPLPREDGPAYSEVHAREATGSTKRSEFARSAAMMLTYRHRMACEEFGVRPADYPLIVKRNPYPVPGGADYADAAAAWCAAASLLSNGSESRAHVFYVDTDGGWLLDTAIAGTLTNMVPAGLVRDPAAEWHEVAVDLHRAYLAERVRGNAELAAGIRRYWTHGYPVGSLRKAPADVDA